MSHTVRLETGVIIMSLHQLEDAWVRAQVDSVFDWLGTLVESQPLLLTNNKGLECRQAAQEGEGK